MWSALGCTPGAREAVARRRAKIAGTGLIFAFQRTAWEPVCAGALLGACCLRDSAVLELLHESEAPKAPQSLWGGGGYSYAAGLLEDLDDHPIFYGQRKKELPAFLGPAQIPEPRSSRTLNPEPETLNPKRFEGGLSLSLEGGLRCLQSKALA